jgi:hypothetical protein
MLDGNCIALKEWAAVCAALDAGRQCLLLRTGGIDEGPAGFRIDHGEFWLFPTRFHQQPGELIPAAEEFLQQSRLAIPTPGTVSLQLYGVVHEVARIDDEAVLQNLDGLHVWSEETIRQRFHYRRPGLFAVTLRVYRRPLPLEISDTEQFAGCRSWVDLAERYFTHGLSPVLSDADFQKAATAVRTAITAV